MLVADQWSGSHVITFRTDGGLTLPLAPDRWHGEPSALERLLLATVSSPVLDVGCGPGRLVGDLSRRGIPALGLEPLADPARLARERGATVLQRSIFDRVPCHGRWGTILLVDGNIGIGGDPTRLLARCADLMASHGTIVVEVEPPGVATGRHRARIEDGDRRSPWFAWAVVGADGIDEIAEQAGLRVASLATSEHEPRWFARLAHRARLPRLDTGGDRAVA